MCPAVRDAECFFVCCDVCGILRVCIGFKCSEAAGTLACKVKVKVEKKQGIY